jgi:acrylyl-CoA reductase (NADPH)
MSSTFLAFRIHESGPKIERLSLEDLSPGEVVIRVAWSGINYKDALAATGAGKILRKYPLVGGIDLAGTVESSSDDRFKAGAKVLVTGCDLSEQFDGGYAELARVRADAVVPIPAGLDERAVMAIGTAGFTAALAVDRMEHNGQKPGERPIAVTGATGGVGSFAIDMLAGRGFPVCAISGKAEAAEYLKSLGARTVMSRQEIQYSTRPLEKTLFDGAVDNVGGDLLGWLTRSIAYGGNIASVGLAGGAELKTTVIPFILRAVNLLGINSVSTPRDLRLAVWQRIASTLRPRHLDRIVTREIGFEELPGAFAAYLKGEVTGRTVVRIGGPRSDTIRG